MSDREKVINYLESEIKRAEQSVNDIWLECVEVKLLRDALALLKEQEVKPICCKECSYHRNDGWCNEHGREVKESDYCSFGAQ